MKQQVYNPLGFTCAPNQSTPDYIIYDDFEQWLAYGLISCWLSHTRLDPNGDCHFSRPVTRDDVEELRGYFLDLVETIIVAIWNDDREPGDGWVDMEHQHLFISREDDSEETTLYWAVRLDDDAMMFVLSCTGADDECIWLSYEGIADRHKVVEVMRRARATISDSQVYSELLKLENEETQRG